MISEGSNGTDLHQQIVHNNVDMLNIENMKGIKKREY